MANDKSSLTTWARLAWGFIFLVLVLVVIVVRWCWWCPQVPDCTDCTEANIIVEDAHAGVWMAFENATFKFYDPSQTPSPLPGALCTDVPGTPQNEAWGTCTQANFDNSYRHGVMFQAGVTKDLALGSSSSNFGGVHIKHGGGEIDLIPGVSGGPFPDWLDVREAASECVIDPATAYTMFNNNVTAATTICDPLGMPTTDPAYHCSRLRSLHASVEATFLMTYWAGVRHYSMDIAATDEIGYPKDHDHPKHVSYRFALPSPVTVDRWKDGCYQESYADVTEIRILYDPSAAAAHLGYPHKPMNGK